MKDAPQTLRRSGALVLLYKSLLPKLLQPDSLHSRSYLGPSYLLYGSLALLGSAILTWGLYNAPHFLRSSNWSQSAAQEAQAPVFSRTLDELRVNLSSRVEFIQMSLRLDLDQNLISEMARLNTRVVEKFTAISQGKLGARWNTGYSKKKTARLTGDDLLDRYMPRLKDSALTLIANLSPADLQSPEWIPTLRQQMQEEFNRVMKLPQPVIVNVGISSWRVSTLD